MYDIGSQKAITVRVTDAAGGPVDPAAGPVLTITLPDDTTVSPAMTHTGTGTYTYNYTNVLSGLHRWRATTTTPDTGYGDVWNVWPTQNVAFIGFEETKLALNMDLTDTSQDADLRDAIVSACCVVEHITGVMARRTFTQTFIGNGLRTLLLSYLPVISVLSVVESGSTLVSGTDYTVSPAGVLMRLGMGWISDVTLIRNVVATYVAGRTNIPPNAADAAKELVRVNFRPQLGGNYSPFDANPAEPRVAQGEVRLGFFVPNTVMERLEPSGRGPLIA